MAASTFTAENRRRRLRSVEELYLNGYCAREITDLLDTTYGVAYGTIRNDIAAVRKWWTEDLGTRDATEGGQRYLASLRAMRRRVMDGWTETDVYGRSATKGRDYKLAHQLDKEIARLSGYRLKSDEQTIQLDVKQAQEYMTEVMAAVFKHVTDRETQDAILADLEAAGDAEEPA